MANYIIRNSGGVILNYLSGVGEPVLAEGEFLEELPEHSPQSIRDGEYWFNTESRSIERPLNIENPILVSSPYIVSDGISSSTLSDLPDPCWIRLNNTLVEVIGGNYQVTSNTSQDIVIKLAGKYRSDNIIYIKARPYEELQKTKWEDVKRVKTQTLFGGCYTPKGRVDTSADSQTTISFYALQAVQDPDFTIDWTMKDNSIVTHNAVEFTALYQAVLDFKKNCQIRSEYFRDLINASTTIEQLNAINIYEGWPT